MTAPVPPVDLGPKIWARITIDPTSECWVWTGGRVGRGYGQIVRGGRHWLVHRYVWTVLNGDIPEAGYICHVCDNPPCCNPEHLFLGDALINTRDMFSKGRNRNGKDRQTHCISGHPLSGENVRIQAGRKGNPRRVCRACKARYEADRRKRVAEALADQRKAS